MNIDVITTFPEIFDSYMNQSMMKRAQDKGLLNFKSHNLRDWTSDLHHTTDDKPYGGGCGQLMLCEPIFKAFDDIVDSMDNQPYTIILDPTGEQFNDACAQELSKKDSLLFICGHYEGIDHRVYSLADKVYSIGDYVLTGGELASIVVIDSTVRKIDGVLGAQNGADDDSFVDGLLEAPQYTRPSEFRGMNVPDVLVSGDHAKIAHWKKEQSIKRTLKYRPDLLEKAKLDEKDKEILKKLAL